MASVSLDHLIRPFLNLLTERRAGTRVDARFAEQSQISIDRIPHVWIERPFARVNGIRAFDGRAHGSRVVAQDRAIVSHVAPGTLELGRELRAGDNLIKKTPRPPGPVSGSCEQSTGRRSGLDGSGQENNSAAGASGAATAALPPTSKARRSIIPISCYHSHGPTFRQHAAGLHRDRAVRVQVILEGVGRGCEGQST